jgi:sugar phosphate isomerase/epimerase
MSIMQTKALPTLPRRQLIQVAASGLALASLTSSTHRALAVDPFMRTKPGKLRLSLAAYSLRDLLTKPIDGMNLFQFIDYCYEHGVRGAELTSYYFPKDFTDAYIAELKQYCHRKGVTITGGAIANDFCQSDPAKISKDIEHTIQWIDRYSLLGAPVIRIFAGNQPSGDSMQATIDRCVAACEIVGDYAASKGMYLGIENHGGVTAKAEDLVKIVQRIQSKGIGINLDSGNFRSTDDPYAELGLIAPYAVNAQIKVEIFPNNKRQESDLGQVMDILRTAGYSGWVALEYEAADDPLVAVPKWIERLSKLMD